VKLLQRATITPSDSPYDQDEYTNAKVVKNGSVVSITVPNPDARRPGMRLDRVFDATWTDKGPLEVVITGRSEYLTAMGADAEGQQITILAQGGPGENCRSWA
jgi:hypothetical protein